jgi:hypothetical protein
MQELWDRDGTREALVRETQARLALLDGQPLQALPWLQEQMERLIVLSNRLAQHEERIRRVVMVNTCDTDAVLQDFLQTVRAWDAGRPHVPITRSVDTPQLSPCPCAQGAYDVQARSPGVQGECCGAEARARPRVKSTMAPSAAPHGASQACCEMVRCRRGLPRAPAQARVQTLPLDPGPALRYKKAPGCGESWRREPAGGQHVAGDDRG